MLKHLEIRGRPNPTYLLNHPPKMWNQDLSRPSLFTLDSKLGNPPTPDWGHRRAKTYTNTRQAAMKCSGLSMRLRPSATQKLPRVDYGVAYRPQTPWLRALPQGAFATPAFGDLGLVRKPFGPPRIPSPDTARDPHRNQPLGLAFTKFHEVPSSSDSRRGPGLPRQASSVGPARPGLVFLHL